MNEQDNTGAEAPLAWAEAIGFHGSGDTATVDIDVKVPGEAEPQPLELPLEAARVLHAMLGDLLDEATPAPAPAADLREQVAAAVRETVTRITDLAAFDQAIADAVLAVPAIRDMQAEVERLRARVAELEGAQATPHEMELRQRRAWNAAGRCPMCNFDDTDGYLCGDCLTTVRRLSSPNRRAWRIYEPPATGTPIQGHGYTPAGLLGIATDHDATQPPTA